jgi:hypothetical protein
MLKLKERPERAKRRVRNRKQGNESRLIVTLVCFYPTDVDGKRRGRKGVIPSSKVTKEGAEEGAKFEKSIWSKKVGLERR